MVQSLLKTIGKFHNALEIKLPYDAAVTLLGIYPEELKSGSQRDVCTSMFTVAFLTTAKIQKQPECPSTHERV